MRRNLIKIMAIVLSLTFILTGCGPKTPAAGNEEKEVLRIGLEAGYPPFNWTQQDDSNGAVKIEGSQEYAGGYDVEIAKRVADALGKELKVYKIEWNGLLPALTSGTIDAIMAGMSPTAERLESIDFTENYYESEFVMVVKNGGPYTNATKISDFNGAKITGQLNTSHYGVIDQIEGVIKQEAMEDFTTMRVALESGIIDGYVSERPEGTSAKSANPNFTFIEFEDGFVASPEETAVAAGIVKGSELKDKINEVLSGISLEERLAIMDDAIVNQPAAQE